MVITDAERDFLKVRGKKYGLYILGATSVTQDAIAFFEKPVSLNEKDIPALSEKAKLIKANGTKAINQLQHAEYWHQKNFQSYNQLDLLLKNIIKYSKKKEC